ncbi:MAG: AsmA family protein [Desulfohalobiaceae bacterium]|nr:AsmA family protein [Desulfohalobiaceae bacterium]
MANRKKISRWIAGVFGVLLVLLIAAMIALPRVMDLEQVRDRVRVTLSRAIGGEMEFKTFRISLFPPGGRMTGLRLQHPNIKGTAGFAQADVSLMPLFLGNLEIDSVFVREPDFSLEIAEPDWLSGAKESRPWTPGRVRGRISEALSKIDPSLRDASFKVQEGAIAIKQPGKPDHSFQNVNLELLLPGEELAIELTAKSNLFEFLDFSGSINRDGSDARGEFAVRGLRPGQVSRLFEQNATRAFAKARVSLRLDFESKASDTIYKNLAGTLSLAALDVEGPLRRPGLWEFQGQGAVHDLVLEAADLPSPFKLKTGEFEGSGKRVTGRLEGVDLLGSSLSISGTARDPGQGFSSMTQNPGPPCRGPWAGTSSTSNFRVNWLPGP